MDLGYCVAITARRITFSDATVLPPRSSTADSAERMDTMRSYLRAFLDQSLRGSNQPLLNQAPGQYGVTEFQFPEDHKFSEGGLVRIAPTILPAIRGLRSHSRAKKNLGQLTTVNSASAPDPGRITGHTDNGLYRAAGQTFLPVADNPDIQEQFESKDDALIREYRCHGFSGTFRKRSPGPIPPMMSADDELMGGRKLG